jgi:hypothetical protein
MMMHEGYEYPRVIDEICDLNWRALSRDEMVSVAWAYYHFSIQFRENLEIARRLYPDDPKLRQLEQEECDTDNLSPWPGVAQPGERLNHDEFMRRTLDLMPIDPEQASRLEAIGAAYLADMRNLDDVSCAASIASYEDGGLERVFRAMLEFRHWEEPLLAAFQHFLTMHIKFDSDPEQGHGALSRHMVLDDSVLPLWQGFKHIFITSAPRLSHPTGHSETDLESPGKEQSQAEVAILA